MKLVTIQDKKVLDIINKNGSYKVDPSKIRYSRLIDNYKVMTNIMREDLDIENTDLPIWCYYKIMGEDLILDINAEEYFHKGTSGLNDNTVLIELEVPDNLILLSDYYSWSDYIYFTNEEPDEFESTRSLSKLKDINLDDTVQATIFEITKDMVRSVSSK